MVWCIVSAQHVPARECDATSTQHCDGVLVLLVLLLLLLLQQVSTDVITAALEGTDNPQWTCGVVVDGQLSCTGVHVGGGAHCEL